MIREHTQKEIEWIEKKYKVTVSKFMKEVLDILDHVYQGLHHIRYYDQFKKKDYCEKQSIQYVEESTDLSTYDYDELTILVILAHEKGIRISLKADRKRGLVISFSNRMGKRSKKLKFNQRHPELSEVLIRMKKNKWCKE